MWTSREIAYLRAHAELGAEELASRLGKTRGAVKRAASRFRISLRQPGSRRGSMLGQPRGVSMRRDLEALAGGSVDVSRLERRRRLEAEGELCPSCARDYAEPTSGLCRPCHLRRLARLHREDTAAREREEEAQRDLWQARQAKKRSRAGASS